MKYLVIVMLFGLFHTAMFAQNQESKEKKEKKEAEDQEVKNTVVPSVVLQAFAKDFPGAKANWDAEDNGFEAMFTQNGVESSATYNSNGHLEETEMEIKIADLPTSVATYVTKNYAGYTLTEAAKMINDKKVVTYEAEIKKGSKHMDVIFDADGKFIREAKQD